MSVPAASKNDAHIKSGQNQLKNNHLASLSLNPWHVLYLWKILLDHGRNEGVADSEGCRGKSIADPKINLQSN